MHPANNYQYLQKGKKLVMMTSPAALNAIIIEKEMRAVIPTFLNKFYFLFLKAQARTRGHTM